jgi:hypothetical protein
MDSLRPRRSRRRGRCSSSQTVADLLSRLRILDVHLAIDGNRLPCSAPKGVLTPELKAELGVQSQKRLARERRQPSCRTGKKDFFEPLCRFQPLRGGPDAQVPWGPTRLATFQ